jgi:tetratricopeptide (TPR) repeat protein
MNNITPSIPSFAFNYWRPWKEGSSVIDSYLDYRKDISLVKYGADTVGKYIQSSSKEQVNAINKVGHDIGKGLNILSYLTIESTNQTVNAINNLGAQIEDIFSKTNDSLTFINRKIDIQIEQQKISNLLLQNISELLRVPDSEKERQHCIELGLKFFVNAQKDSDLFADALEELLKAEALMKQDYFVLHRIGCIYLYADKYINPEKALEYFKKAAKYSSVESDPKAIRLVNVLTTNFNSPNAEVNNSIEKLQLLTADSFEKAAFAAYVLGDFNEATLNQNKAFKYNPESKNQFLLSKYQFRNGNVTEALENLDQAIESNPHFFDAIVQLSDLDVAGEPQVAGLLQEKNNRINIEIENQIGIAKKLKSNVSSEIASDLENLKIELLYSKKLLDLNKKKEELITVENKTKESFAQIDVQINRLLDRNQYRTFNESKRKYLINSLTELKNINIEDAIIHLNEISEDIRIDIESDLFHEGFIETNERDFKKQISIIEETIIEIQKTKFCNLSEIEIQEIITELKNLTCLNLSEFSHIKNKFIVIQSIIEKDKLKLGVKFAGGIVFFIDQNGKNGLVVAEHDISEAQEYNMVVNHHHLGKNAIVMKGHANWGGAGRIGTSKKFGSGKINTQLIVEKASWNSGFFSKKPAPTAARLCTEWSHNGYKDWYLPSILELKMIFDKGYINHIPKKGKNGLFEEGPCYWSSSEIDGDRALYYSGFTESDMPKDRIAYVRAIRSF